MRGSLLEHHPQARAATLRDLVDIANAMVHETMFRYGELASLMERRGEEDTAEAFRRMRQEMQNRAAAIAASATTLKAAAPRYEASKWRPPPEIAASLSEAAASSLLTPYRAFAIGVRNAERTFALYCYLAAHAEVESVAAEAERWAQKELEHAALLRSWRRASYHAERGGNHPRSPTIATLAELNALLERREGAISSCHRELARRLRQLGAEQSATALLNLLNDASRPPDAAVACLDPDCRDNDPLRLLLAAQKPLERLSEELEEVLGYAEGELAAAAEAALLNVIGRLGRLTAQIGIISQPLVQARWPMGT